MTDPSLVTPAVRRAPYDLIPLDRLVRLDNFGHSIRSAAFLYRASGSAQILEALAAARRSGLTVGLRGAGRTYGDGALNSGQIVLDLTPMNRILEWDPDTGVITVEPGVTIQQLWQHVLPDGWWPPVVPGTMFPTLGGALAMNIHGKNNYRMGTLGDHVLQFTVLLPTGEQRTCRPALNSDLFYAIIGSAGLLGVFTSITLRLKRIHSGNVRVHARAVPDLGELLADLDRSARGHDYAVGWVDATAGGSHTGRGQIHFADYLAEGSEPHPTRTLRLDHQALPHRLGGIIPQTIMRIFTNDVGVAWVNAAKYRYSRMLQHESNYLQSLAAFSFLLDFVPNWERAYGAHGLIQYQSFLPLGTAADAYDAILRRSLADGLPSYLGVAKRHRPDSFLFTHAVDGYSLALDFRVTRWNGAQLHRLADAMNEIVLQAGGRFYFAKDSTLTADATARYLGADTLQRFRALKTRCDPEHILQTDLYRRLLGGADRATGRADVAAGTSWVPTTA